MYPANFKELLARNKYTRVTKTQVQREDCQRQTNNVDGYKTQVNLIEHTMNNLRIFLESFIKKQYYMNRFVIH